MQDVGLRKQYLKRFIFLVSSFGENKDINGKIIDDLGALKACTISGITQYFKGVQPKFHNPIRQTHTLIEMDAHGKERMNGFLLAISKFKLKTKDTNREAIADMKAVEEHVQWPDPSVQEFDDSDNQSEALYKVTYDSNVEVDVNSEDKSDES